ncbi:MAG: hypothetical protein KME26_20025 [Oscillatoria princeps RMCB-10]|nr:hypothetical protein [Oscillatoria princeps RMCB-10]
MGEAGVFERAGSTVPTESRLQSRWRSPVRGAGRQPETTKREQRRLL